MKMTKRVMLFAMLIFSSLILVSCAPKITEETLQNLVFEDKTVEYNGEAHSIVIDNTYKEQGVVIEYEGNEKKVPGTYTIKAKITYEEIVVEKEATLTINKAESTLTAEATQTFYMNDTVELAYTLNNDKQKVTVVDSKGASVTVKNFARPGKYEVELYAKENTTHLESNHVKVTIIILQSAYNVTFESKKVIADGTEQVLELVGTLPNGFSVEYENNKGTTDGKYYATANIKNAAGEVVETHKAILEIDNPENVEFAEYLDEFFVTYLEDDQLSVNIFCENPADFGLEHYDAVWYTYESFEQEDLEKDIELFKDLLKELEAYKDVELNNYQEIAYKNIKDFLNYYIDFYNIPDSFFMKVTYVDQFGGYVADFGTYMEAYSLRSEQEVKDVISYIESTKDAFPSYLDFVDDKADKGYALSDYTIEEMRGYLKDLLDSEEGYYLEAVLLEKIDGLSFLTDEQKSDYKNQVTKAIDECFMPGVEDLYDGLEKYKGKLAGDKAGYWAVYENGQELYELTLEDLLGYDDIDLEEYIKELDAEIKKTSQDATNKFNGLIKIHKITTQVQLDNVLKRNSIFDGTPDEMMEYLKEFAKTIVPELESEPNIVIKEMDEASAKVSNAVAYYMKSALDNTGSEYITLNPVKLLSETNNEIIGTLAHEGYPGHLYAYVFSKEQNLPAISTIMTNTVHGEGWATYVQLKLYEYAKATSSNNKINIVMDYLYANQLAGYLLETRIDVGVHYQGWNIDKVGAYLAELGYDSSAATEIYNLIIETPTQYASYGYGKYIFNKLHVEAKKILGNYYDEIEFNTMLLSNGWVGLETLEAMYEDYIEAKCFEYGIER